MSRSDHPCLSIAIARLKHGQSPESPQATDHFAIWVFNAPYPGGYVHHDCVWPESLTQTWLAWHNMFSLRGLPNIPLVHQAPQNSPSLGAKDWELPTYQSSTPPMTNYSGRLMQHLGISLWQWVFEGSIQNSLAQSQGIAIGQSKPLRLRLEIRDPDLIALPWEIMQPQAGKQAISLSQQLLFSRTSSDVDPLPLQDLEQSLNILLVLGQDTDQEDPNHSLQLEQEANVLAQVLESSHSADLLDENSFYEHQYHQLINCRVDSLMQPTPAELITRLETGNYNILFYAGHGVPGPDGGVLFVRSDETLSGTELAQVLVRCQVKLAVFNTCWGAQPDQDQNQQFLSRSSLAEVLIHHGVPAVLAMRDSIADQEALTFIQVFAQGLKERRPIDEAVAVARQKLLTLYKFNQPAWTLPVLYMHPQFNGQLIRPIEENITELPGIPQSKDTSPIAYLRAVGTNKIWSVKGGVMRVGRLPENDFVIQEQWVSQKHAEIICRNLTNENALNSRYFLRDFSRFGTFILSEQGWQKVHHQEVVLISGTKLKFGSDRGQILEFIIEQFGN